ncbi:mitochondrial fission 1 protein A [Tanacetum coccineum]
MRGANPSTRGLGWSNRWCTVYYANSSAEQLSWYEITAAPREILLYTSSWTRFLNRTSIGERCKHREQLRSEYESASDERIFELRYPRLWTQMFTSSDIFMRVWVGTEQMKKVMYYYAVAHFRLDEFSKSAECVDRCLEKLIQPNYWKALNLKKIIEARVRRDRVYNKIINGATNIGVVTIACNS